MNVSKLILAIAPFAFFAAATAEAQPPTRSQRVLVSEMFVWNLNAPMIGSMQVDSMNAEINLSRRTIALNVTPAYDCPPGAYCAAVMPQPVRIELPLLAVTTDFCGSKVYYASRDMRPADGILETITLHDNTGNTCMHTTIMAPVDGTYETESFWTTHSTRSTFSGNALKKVYRHF